MNPFTDRQAYIQAVAAHDEHSQYDHAPTDEQTLGPITLVCLILNRIIGSGIFLTPARILRGTGSVGISLLFWTFGSIYGAAGLTCWLQFGLSIPFYTLAPGRQKNVPRSGGEKNYIEYLFPRPRFLATCMYGIPFILLANLSGNAIAFGIQVMRAAGYDNPSRGVVTALSISVLALCASFHIFSRRGGIFVNNIFALVKVAVLATIIVLGFIKAGGGLSSSGRPEATDNLSPHDSFDTERHDVASYVRSMFYVCYSYFGFEQPFHVLSEVRNPRKIFPVYTPIAMGIVAVLYLLTNIAYLCAVPKEAIMNLEKAEDMAPLFFRSVFGNDRAERAMAGIIAISVFGNILVQTFTAARVKQEIAKEGILPLSPFFATGRTTPWELLRAKFSHKPRGRTRNDLDAHPEQTPMAALGLHFLTSIFLVAVTSSMDPSAAYGFLVSLYSYVIAGIFGLIVSGGLLYLNIRKSRNWETVRNYQPLLGPIPALFYFVVNGFFLFGAFAKPEPGSPYSNGVSERPWYLVPAIGLSTFVWGLVWYGGIKVYERLTHRTLEVEREPFIRPVDMEKPEGEWIQRSEIVDIRWIAKVG